MEMRLSVTLEGLARRLLMRFRGHAGNHFLSFPPRRLINPPRPVPRHAQFSAAFCNGKDVGLRSLDLRHLWMEAARQQRRSLHDHAFDATTALHGLFANQTLCSGSGRSGLAARLWKRQRSIADGWPASIVSYPIIRFLDIPDEIHIVLASRRTCRPCV